MLHSHMAEAQFLRALDKLRKETSEAMFKVALGDSHGHARLKGLREGLDNAEAAFRSAAKQDDEGMSS